MRVAGQVKKIRLSVTIDPELRKQIKILATHKGVSMESWVNQTLGRAVTVQSKSITAAISSPASG